MTNPSSTSPPTNEAAGTRAKNGYQHPSWPAERFYWAILDASSLPRKSGLASMNGKHQERLDYLFENFLPGMAIEEVQTAYFRLVEHEARYVACGIPKTVLEEVDDESITLTPDSLPTFIEAECDPNSLNMLTGTLTPSKVRSLNRRWACHTILLALVSAGIILFGFERRVADVNSETERVSAQTSELYDEVLGESGAQNRSQPPHLQLIAERRRLEQTRHSPALTTESTDTSQCLHDLLLHWPNDLIVQTESVSVTPMSIVIRSRVQSMADAQVMADALRALSDWSIKQPHSEARKDYVNLTLRMERTREEVIK